LSRSVPVQEDTLIAAQQREKYEANLLSSLQAWKPPWEAKLNEISFEEKPLAAASGELGVAYKGKYRGHDVLVKKLRCQSMSIATMDAIKRDAEKLSEIAHPNLARFYAVSSYEVFLAISEFIDGQILYEYLRGPISDSELQHNVRCLKWMRQTADAMAHLHARDITHRLLTTKNIIIDRSNNVKLVDFGLDYVKSWWRKNGGAISEVAYVAPEAITNTASFLPSADVYSFGVCAAEMFARGPVWGDLAPRTIVAGVTVTGRTPTSPSATPNELVEIIESCWRTPAMIRPQFVDIIKSLSEVHLQILDPTALLQATDRAKTAAVKLTTTTRAN